MDIGFFFEYENTVIQLPVNPSKVSVNMGSDNKTMDIIKLGSINLIKNAKLREISFDSFFPYSEWFPGIRTVGSFRRPEFYKNFFEGIKEDKKPCRFIVTGIDINMKVSVETFNYYHQAGDHEDAYYSLELKEYRDHIITEVSNTNSLSRVTPSTTKTVPQKASTTAPVVPTQITVGCEVLVNGTVHYDSYGAKPGKTLNNYKGRIGLINKKGTHPYHVNTPSGGWLGWVTERSVKLV